jgi:hypothetical protein
MSLKPICDSCELELTDYGAILLSPPDIESQVTKFHICKKCYRALVDIHNIRPHQMR